MTDQDNIAPNLVELGPNALRILRQLLLDDEARLEAISRIDAGPQTAGADTMGELLTLCEVDIASRVKVLVAIQDLGV